VKEAEMKSSSIFNPEETLVIKLPEKTYRADAMENRLESMEIATLKPQEILNMIVAK
jgi:hypothetical protein